MAEKKNGMDGMGKPSPACVIFVRFYFLVEGYEAKMERCSYWLNLGDGKLDAVIVFAFSACLIYFIYKQ